MKFPRINIRRKKPDTTGTASQPQPAENTTEFMPHEDNGEELPVGNSDTPKNPTPTTEQQMGNVEAEAVNTAPDAIPVISERISLNAVFGCIWRNKWKYVLPLLATGVFVSWIALSIPRYYSVTVMLAPEYNIPSSGISNAIGGLAGSLGINVGSGASTDAIVPMFYPDLIGSTDFLVPLFDVQVTTKDGKFKGRYADYLTKMQKHPWWEEELNKLKNRIAPPPTSEPRAADEPINPFALTFAEDALMRGIKGSISCTVDKKTDVITLTTKSQDPLVAALIADTVRQRLQDFIIDYRTQKARGDLAHVRKLCEDAHADYLKKQHEYAKFVDANQDLVLETFKAKERDLEDEMQLAFNAYSQLLSRVQSAEAKVQERTPVFTTLQNASVPVKHEGPKRVLMVLASLIAAFIVTTIVLISRDKHVRW